MNSNDLKAGRIAPLVLAGGAVAVVSPCLRVDEMTFAERQQRNVELRFRLLTRDEGLEYGYRPDEIDAWFR